MKIHPLIYCPVASLILFTGLIRGDDSTALNPAGKIPAASAPMPSSRTATAPTDEPALRRGHTFFTPPPPLAAGPAERTLAEKLPPLPEGTSQLDYRDFFKMPVGDRGLEVTDKLKSLDGKRVRILGYMVQEDHTADEGEETGVVPGRFLLTPAPAAVSFPHYGVCDDLPPQTVFVTAPDFAGKEVPHTQRPLLLTGILSVGNKDEAEGRISVARLLLDPTPAPAATPQQPTLSPITSSNPPAKSNLSQQ